MPMTSKDMERLIPYGWVGSHRQYKHPTKKSKVTIPLSKSTEQSILKQAGLK